MSILFIVHHSTSDPTCMWHGSSHVAWVFVQAIAQHTEEGFTFSHTHTKQKQKEQLKLQTPKIVLKKPKEGKKEHQQEKIEINKIFKNYRKIII